MSTYPGMSNSLQNMKNIVTHEYLLTSPHTNYDTSSFLFRIIEQIFITRKNTYLNQLNTCLLIIGTHIHRRDIKGITEVKNLNRGEWGKLNHP